MAHVTDQKKKLLTRLSRIQGQLEGIRKALKEEQECSAMLQQIAACRGAMNGLMLEILEGEVRFHVLSPNAKANSSEARAAEELIEVLHTYIK
ncbi:MAG TPA: metal/formaldehyde-sensitive transcriptional repressor [Verrucomicrobiae bacterium]|nr:metal/formaldehyde-sensitive transcriptional repressor [Verrucomicrobiae bacterium]